MNLTRARARRRIGLTPMIDVVFLLLIFFMLAARFGADVAIPLALGGGTSGYSGPPRLVEVMPDGLSLNGVATARDTLAADLAKLMETPGDVIVVRPGAGVATQRLIDVIDWLREAGFDTLTVVA